MKIEREEFEREKNHLNETVSLIRRKISSLGQELYDDDTKVLEFKKFIWDSHAEMDPNEMRIMMAESDLQVSIMQSKGNYLQRLFKVQNKPCAIPENAVINQRVAIFLTFCLKLNFSIL